MGIGEEKNAGTPRIVALDTGYSINDTMGVGLRLQTGKDIGTKDNDYNEVALAMSYAADEHLTMSIEYMNNTNGEEKQTATTVQLAISF